MSESQNRGIRNMKRRGNMTPQKVNSHTTKDQTDSKGDKTSISGLKRRMIRMINEIKNTCENKSMKSKRIWTNS
jgi:hypothetical protein